MFTDTLVIDKYDVCAFTESLLNESDCIARKSMTPDLYTLIAVPRRERRGGGTGLISKSYLKPKLIDSAAFNSYEYSEYLVTCKSTHINVFVIYWPNYSNSTLYL